MHYNYYSDIVWAADWALAGIIILTGAVAVIYALAKDHVWKRRRDGLLRIKRNVYEMVLSGQDPSNPACQAFISSVTPQQFIDIMTNRNRRAAFFNESEQAFLKNCFVSPAQAKRLEKIIKFSMSKWRRIEAMLCLGYTQRDEAVDIIKRSVCSRDEDVAYFSIISLGQIKTRESARELLKCLKKNTPNSYKIISILAVFPEDIAQDVVKLTEDRDPDVRKAAAILLSKFNAAPYTKELKDLAHDESAEVRAAACDCLASAASAKGEAKTILKQRLKDDNWLVRAHAVLAIEKVMGDDAVAEVIDMINDASWSVVNAVRDVMIAHIEASLPFIKKFFEGGYEVAKKYSLSALEESGYLEKLLKDAESHDPVLKRRALEILAFIKQA